MNCRNYNYPFVNYIYIYIYTHIYLLLFNFLLTFLNQYFIIYLNVTICKCFSFFLNKNNHFPWYISCIILWEEIINVITIKPGARLRSFVALFVVPIKCAVPVFLYRNINMLIHGTQCV